MKPLRFDSESDGAEVIILILFIICENVWTFLLSSSKYLMFISTKHTFKFKCHILLTFMFDPGDWLWQLTKFNITRLWKNEAKLFYSFFYVTFYLL